MGHASGDSVQPPLLSLEFPSLKRPSSPNAVASGSSPTISEALQLNSCEFIRMVQGKG